jgi:hypothetical protein
LGKPTILQNYIRVRDGYENVLISYRKALLSMTPLYLKIRPVELGSSKTSINFYLLHGITLQSGSNPHRSTSLISQKTTWKIMNTVVVTYELNLN